MCAKLLSLSLLALLFLLTCADPSWADSRNSTTKKREKADLGTKDFSNESQFTGDVSFTIPIASKGGVDVALKYCSNVHRLIPTDNRFSPPGWVGLGWTLSLGCIQADNNNTKDPTDDKYFYVGPDATSELIVDTLNQFMLREYRHWKITRQVSNGTVVGWTVVTEDGTTCRYGNYDKASGLFSIDSLPTHATRSFIGCGNLIQTTISVYGSASLVPYEWDLSDVEDVDGDHTTIRYQQFKEGIDGTDLLFTCESYPKEIIERNGRKIEFRLHDNPILYFDSPLIGEGQVKKETRSLKQVLTRDAAGNAVSAIEFQYDTMNVLNRSSQNNKKIFLKRVLDLDAFMNPVKTTLFEYAGVTAPLDTGDHNPGALKRITLPEGGSISYRYCNDVVITNRSPEVQSQGRFWSSYGTGRLAPASEMSFWSMSGSDFFVVWKGGFLQAYRWAPNNRIAVDATFPLGSVTSSATSGYWVQNDYVVCKHETVFEVAKRYGEGWRKQVLESNADATNVKVLALGSDYFLYAIDCSGYGGHVKIATYSNTRSWSVQSLGQRPFADRMVCGSRFFSSAGSNWPVFMYNPSTSNWQDVGNQMNYSSAGSDYLLRQSTDTEFQIWRWTGSYWSASYVQGPPYPNVPGATLIPGHNFFLIFGGSIGCQLWVVTNTPTGWRPISYTDLIPAALLDGASRVAVGPDFFAVSWRDANQNMWKVGVVRYKNGQWQQGSIIAELPARELVQGNYEECNLVISGSTLFTEIYEGYHKLQLNSYVYQNEAWDAQELVNMNLGWYTGYQNPLKPFMQPGENFTVCVVDSNLKMNGDGCLLAWKRSFGHNFRQVFCDTIPGGFDYRVSAKTTADGNGSCATTTLENSYGSYDNDINTVRFNKYVAKLPGSNGESISYFYNDLGPGEVGVFRENADFRLLDGMPYDRRSFDKDGNIVRLETNDWSVTSVGAITANRLANPLATYYAGAWSTTTGGPLHTVLDDGETLDPLDYAYSSTFADDFLVRLQAPEGPFIPGSSFTITVDAKPTTQEDGSNFYIVLWEYDGSSFHFVMDGIRFTPPYSDFLPYTLEVPAGYINDPSRLHVGIELLSGLTAVARIKCDYQVRIDQGVYYSRLVQSSETRDGVCIGRSVEYNSANGLVKTSTETNSDGTQRRTETKFAYERPSYADMGTSEHMYSQVYSTTMKNGSSDVDAKKWTLWGNADGVWRPREEWVWKGDGSANDQTAPDDPEGSGEALKVSAVLSYDSHGNLRQSSDATGVNTAVFYGYDSTLAIAMVRNVASSGVFAAVFDDNVLTGWSSSYGTWGIQNGVFRQTDAAAIGSWGTPTKNNLVQIDDAVVEADIRFDNTGSGGYIAVAKVVDASSFLRFECRKSENLVRIHAYAPGTQAYQSQSMTFSENRWYHLRGEIQGQNARFYIDGKKVVELTAAEVDRSAGYIGLCTYATVASFDNVRLYPVGALPVLQVYSPRTHALTGTADENGILQSTAYDPFNRKVGMLIRADGKNVMENEIRYSYSRSIGDLYEKGRPNAVEIISPPECDGYSDMSNSDGWTVTGDDVTFGYLKAGETTVRLGTGTVYWNSISRTAPTTHAIARVDFYPDDNTGGTPHVLAFEGSGYRFCVQYVPSSDRFQMQTNFGSSWIYPLTFDLPAPPNRWYTIELEKTEAGEAYAFVFPKGEGRINKTGYVYDTTGFPSAWSANAISYSNTDSCFLANFYVGLPDRAVAFFDGLGRNLQAQRQLKRATVVETSTQYDSAGRAYRDFKPFEKDYTGVYRHRFDSLYATNGDAYYNTMDFEESHTNGYPYSEKKYFPDPLARLWKQGSPGTVWRIGGGHEVLTIYGSNGYNDLPGYRGNTLFKTSTADEDTLTNWTFVDRFGNNVATVVEPASLNLCTRMHYDLLGNRTKSISPSGDTSHFVYSPISLLLQKSSPDQGTSQYLYDKNGNLRLIKDAAHTGSSANSVYLSSNNVITPYSASGQITLTMPGRVNIDARVYEISEFQTEVLYVRIKANGTLLKTVQTSGWSGASGSIILPKGTYTYEVQATGEAYQGGFGYTISCQTGYEFVYQKFDPFNRLIEVGEYESNSVSGNFTQANAENTSFPTSNTLLTNVLAYDTESTDAHAAGQRNLKGRVSTAKAYRLGTLELTTSYSYNPYGNVEWAVLTNSANQWWQLKYDYDVQGRLTRKSYLVPSGYNLYTFYEYDQMGRLTNAYTGTNADGSGKTQEAAYTYYAGGATKRTQLASVQGVDYRYNTRDWVMMINHQNLNKDQDPGHDGPGGAGVGYVDKFGMVIGYNEIGHIGWAQGAVAKYNGNITWAMYNMAGVTITPGSQYAPTSLVGNTYSYDRASRILGANFGFYAYDQIAEEWGWWGTTRYDESGYQFDANGNITALQRYGNNGSLMDNLTYVYATSTNRLRHISDSVPAGDFQVDIDNQQADNYAYDSNGNLQKDDQRDIGFVVNDIRNLPISMWKKSTGAEYRYYYDDNGMRIRKDGLTTEYYVNGPGGNTEAIVRSDLTKATHNIWGNDNLGQVKRDGSSWSKYYYLKDHLGNIRMTVDASCDIASYDDFYPFGMVMDGRSANIGQGDTRYKFTEKERDVESQYDYFGARYYDARVGRFGSVDRMAMRFPQASPYAYASSSNPLRAIDANGDSTFIVVWRYAQTENTTRGIISVSATNSSEQFVGHTLEPASTDVDPKAGAGEYSAYVRDQSADGSREYDPARVHLEGVMSESGEAMPGAQIHEGNVRDNTTGCILAGETRTDDGVGNSNSAMRTINRIIDQDGGPISVRVVDFDAPIERLQPRPIQRNVQETPTIARTN
jgi:RHS repeat-associated protein